MHYGKSCLVAGIVALFMVLILPAIPVRAEVRFSHDAGTYSSPIALVLAADEEKEIFYTLDGTRPDRQAHRFDGNAPIIIDGSVRVRARTYVSDAQGGWTAGEVTTRVFSILEGDAVAFGSDLPLVVVQQFNQIMEPRGLVRTAAAVTIMDLNEHGRAWLLSDKVHLQTMSEVNYRGSSSLNFPKKQFGMRFVDESGENRNEPVLGLPAENNWIMSAPYDDKTLMRNAVAYRLSREMGRYAPGTRFVELFLHEGSGPITMDHYHGVYMLVERIKWDDNRVDIAKLGPEDNAEPDISGGYIINYDRDVHVRSPVRNTGFALVRPQHEHITPEQREWIEGYIGGLEAALFGPSFTDPETGYRAWLEPESFIDHHLITETLKEIDGYRLSTFLHKDRGGKLIMGPVWDYNISLGNGNYLEAWRRQGWYYPLISSRDYLNGWYGRLFQDQAFSDRYKERWWELRRGPFSTRHVESVIASYAEELKEAQARNFNRWDILGRWVWPNYYVGATWRAEVDYMTQWIKDRLFWIDGQMGIPPESREESLRYFWHFDDTLPNNTPLETVSATYSLVRPAVIRYTSALEGYPFNRDHSQWRKSSMERRNRPTQHNYMPEANNGRPYEEDRMRALQVRQPLASGDRESELVFEMPATGMERVVFRFAARDEGAAEALRIDYSLGPESAPTWTTEGLAQERLVLSGEFQLYEIDFSEVAGVADNDAFALRLRFESEDPFADNGNRVTFNNVSLSEARIVAQGSGGEVEVPDGLVLLQNYPNPFNSGTIITYGLPEGGPVELVVYDVLGRVVDRLVNETRQAGEHRVYWDASTKASGVYVYRITTRSGTRSKSMMLVR